MLRTNTGMQSLYVNDGTTGSPIALITADGYQAFGYDYDPFGVPTLTQDSGGAGTTENPYTFASTGVQERTTGWVRYGYRSYAPVTGSFIQQDTLDALLDPANANRYAYAGNDPVNNIDPTGQSLADVASVGRETLGKASSVYDVYSIGADLVDGNYRSALATGAGLTVSTGVGLVCEGGTAGIGSVACAGGATAAGYVTQSAINGSFS